MQSLWLKTQKNGHSLCFPSLEDQCGLSGQHFKTMKHMERWKIPKLCWTYTHIFRVKKGPLYISDSMFLSEGGKVNIWMKMQRKGSE